MKRILSVLALVLILVSVTSAQWTKNATWSKKSGVGAVIEFAGTMDTTGGTYATLTSNNFSLEDYDGNTDIDYTYYVVCASGAPKVKVTLLRSNETLTAASMQATVLQDSIKTETEASTYKALQGLRTKYYRLKLESIAGGRDAAVFSIQFILPKRDF